MENVKININADQSEGFKNMLNTIQQKFETRDLENGEVEFSIEPNPLLDQALAQVQGSQAAPIIELEGSKPDPAPYVRGSSDRQESAPEIIDELRGNAQPQARG